MKKFKWLIVLILLIFALLSVTACQSLGRDIKTTQSEWTGGLDRHITVYSQSGTLLAEYDGKS